jgi:hypothetical protein
MRTWISALETTIGIRMDEPDSSIAYATHDFVDEYGCVTIKRGTKISVRKICESPEDGPICEFITIDDA